MKKLIVAALVLAGSGTLLANGQAFFIPAGGKNVELVYFGRVKDARTGRPIQVKPYVNVVDPNTGIFIPFQGDSPGHFRSPDIGEQILEVSARPIDTQQFEITVSATGYETTKVKYVPRQMKGTVELNVKLEPRGNGGTEKTPTPTASQNDTASNGTTPVDSYKPTYFVLGACFGLAAISGVARTVGRRSSTER
jgi:hypothetical protein